MSYSYGSFMSGSLSNWAANWKWKKRRWKPSSEHLAVQPAAAPKAERPRRPYPKVLPKYRNPKNPQETWVAAGSDHVG